MRSPGRLRMPTKPPLGFVGGRAVHEGPRGGCPFPQHVYDAVAVALAQRMSVERMQVDVHGLTGMPRKAVLQLAKKVEAGGRASRGGPGPRSSGLASFASFSPKRGGEHAVTLVGGAAPPADVARGDGSGISGVSYAPYARAAGGAAVFATFRCGAVRVYKTTFGVAESAPTRRNGHATHPAFRKSRGALMPTLTATFPSWPGVSRTLSTFIAVAPARDPLGAAECCASVFGGGAATYALPSVASAPPARVGALAAEGNRAAVCAAFDAAAETLVVGYEDGGVLLWRRVAA